MNSYQIPSMYLFSLEEILYIVVDTFGELTIYLNDGESLEPIDCRKLSRVMRSRLSLSCNFILMQA